MRQGNATDAELEFKTLTAGYPQLTGAFINLALLQRKANRLPEAEATLRSIRKIKAGERRCHMQQEKGTGA